MPKAIEQALHVSSNKTAVVTFLVEEGQRGKYAPLIGRHSLLSPLVSSAGCFARVRVMAIQFNGFVCKSWSVFMKRLSREFCYMLSRLPKQGTAQSLFALPTLMWQSLPGLAGHARYQHDWFCRQAQPRGCATWIWQPSEHILAITWLRPW